MRSPITNFFFQLTPMGDYRVQVDFERDGSLRRGTIGEIYSTGRATDKRWSAVLSDGTEMPEVYKTRIAAAEALLDDARAIFSHGRPMWGFTNTGLVELTS